MFRNKFTTAILVVAAVLLLILLNQFQLFSNIIDVILKPIRPVQSFFYQGTTNATSFINNIFLTHQLEKDIKDLTERMAALSKENIKLKDLEQQNATLKDLLNFKEGNKSTQLTVMRVLGKSSFEPTILILDKGSFDGLKVGQAVITENGIFLGKLTKVEEFSSQVMLMTDSRSEISASLARTNQQSGIIVGEKGLSLKMQLIPSDQNIKQGDLIVTSGLEPEIPYGLIIGQVETVTKIPNELFQEAIIKTIIHLDNVVIAAVVKK